MDEDVLTKMIGAIDRASAMADKMAESCRMNMSIYDKHLSSLEESRNRAEKEAIEGLTSVKELTSLLTTIKEDYQAQVQSLRNELHLLRDEYRGQLDGLMSDYRELTQAYTRLAELTKGSSASVKIDR